MAAAASEWSVVAVTRRRRDLTAVISNLISLDVTVSVSATAASYRRSTSKTRSVSTDDSGSLVSSLVALWSGSTTGTRALRTDCQSTKHSELITSENNLPMLHRISKVNTHMFDGPFSGTTRVSRYQKNKTNLDFTEARDSEWQWHQLGRMQVCSLHLAPGQPRQHPTSQFLPRDAMHPRY